MAWAASRSSDRLGLPRQRLVRLVADDHAAAVPPGEVAPGQVDQRGDPVPAAEQVEQVQAEPGEPGQRPGDPRAPGAVARPRSGGRSSPWSPCRGSGTAASARRASGGRPARRRACPPASRAARAAATGSPGRARCRRSRRSGRCPGRAGRARRGAGRPCPGAGPSRRSDCGAATPAVHTVRSLGSSCPSPSTTQSGRTSRISVFSLMSTPRSTSCRLVYSRSFGWNGISSSGAISTSRTCTRAGSTSGKVARSTSLAQLAQRCPRARPRWRRRRPR